MARLVTVIIPSRSDRDDIAGLLADLSSQRKVFEVEVIRIIGVAPVSKARNEGASKAKGEVLVFIDCDIRLGSSDFLVHLISVLEKDDRRGAVCASLQLPLDASRFQKRYAAEVAHCESPVVSEVTDVFVAASACFAIRRDLFLSLGGFKEEIIRGEDSELSLRLRKAGFRTVLAPQTWCYHPAPDNLAQLIRINFRNGVGVSFVDIFYPELNIDVPPEGVVYTTGPKSLAQRCARFLGTFFRAVFKMKMLLFLSKVFYALGYFFGWIKHRVVRG